VRNSWGRLTPAKAESAVSARSQLPTRSGAVERLNGLSTYLRDTLAKILNKLTTKTRMYTTTVIVITVTIPIC
jgi:hypothetical protein